MPNKPHVLIFNPDQWRGDVLGHMGNPAAVTPHLDRAVARDFVSFRSAFCQNPVCTPSRCSFMTGWYTHVRGHRTMHHMLRKEDPCLLKVLKDNGYFVWWGGKNDLVPAQHGFEDYCSVKFAPPDPIEPTTHQLHRQTAGDNRPDYYSMFLGRLEPTITSSAKHGLYYDEDWACVLGAIEQIKNAPKDQPLCIYLPLLYPHPPYAAEEPFYSMIDRNKLPARTSAPATWAAKPAILKGIHDRLALSDADELMWVELRACYYAMCARVDAQFGMVLQALRDADMYDDMAVFFFSDHGDFTGDYSLVEKTADTFEDCLTRVPLLIKPPASVPILPRVSSALVELIDVPATVYDLCGISPGYTHFGRSLRKIIAGESDENRDAVFCEGGRLADELHSTDDQSVLQAGPASPYWPRVGLQQQIPEHGKATMCRTGRYKYVRRLYECDELYDLLVDPFEQHNRIDEPQLIDVRRFLSQRMLLWYQATCDVVPYDLDER